MSIATERLSKVYSWKAKKTAMTGSAYARNLRSAQLEPYRQSVQHVLKVLRHTDDDTALMLKQFESFLFSLPTPPRQNSTRGLPPNQRAQHILKHIWLQQSHYRTRPANEGAALRILVHAMSASLCQKETSAPQYQRTQISRAVYKLLRSDVSTLYGRKLYNRISMQGKWVAFHLFNFVEPHFRYWLERQRARILSQKWLHEPPRREKIS